MALTKVGQLFAGIARGDFYIKAATEAQGGQWHINGAITERMQAQVSGKAPPPFVGFMPGQTVPPKPKL